ncbi:hypothetical protein KAU15_05570, partial [candidate division WOR-3 bacterium]|nr:hypothetical protein [candidate division WOR-3 bacterium]
MSRKKKTLIITFICLLIITITIPLLVNTNTINRIIKSRLEVILSKTLNGECRIGNLRADITSFHVDTLYISNDNVISQVEEIKIGLSIYSLLTGRILINFIEVSDIFVNVKTKSNLPETDNKGGIDIDNFFYKYPLSNFAYNIDIKTLKIKNFHLQYDTFFISNISLNASISFNRNRIILFYKLMSGKVDDYLNIVPSEGEIVFSTDKGILQGNIQFKEANINYDIMLLDSNINIKYISGDINLKNIRLFEQLYSVNGKYKINGIVSSNEYYINMFTHFDNIIIDSIEIQNTEIDASLRNDSVILNKITINNDFADLYATGMIEVNQFPSSEFELKINRFESKEFPLLSEYLHFGVKGNIGLKVSDFSNITIFVNDFCGVVGGDSIRIIDGSLSYIQNMFCTNKFTLLYDDGLVSVKGQIRADKGEINLYFDKFPIMNIIKKSTNIYANGLINGNIKINGGWLNPCAEFQLALKDINYDDIEVSNIEFSGFLETTENRIPDVLLTLNSVNAKYRDYNIPIMYLEIVKSGYNIYTSISAFSDIGLFEYEGDFVYDEIHNKFYGLIRQMALNDEQNNIHLSKPVYINVSKDTIEISDVNIYGEGMHTSFSFAMINDSFKMNAEFSEDSFGLINRLSNGNISGSFFAHISAFGTFDDPNIEAIINSSNLNIYGIEIDSFSVKADLVNNKMNIEKLSFSSGEYISNINGEVFFTDFKDLSHDSINIDLDLNHIDKRYFIPLFDVFVINDGYADIKAHVDGSLDNPSLSGNVYLNDIDVNIIELGTRITNINGNAYFKGDSLIIKKVNGISGNGDVLVYGSVTKKGYMLDRYDFSIIANDINLDGIDYVDVTGDCNINICGSVTVP